MNRKLLTFEDLVVGKTYYIDDVDGKTMKVTLDKKINKNKHIIISETGGIPECLPPEAIADLIETESSNMMGQLYQECFCGTEPVCAMCEKCKKHCACLTDKQYKTELKNQQYKLEIKNQILIIINYITNFAEKLRHNQFGDGDTIFENVNYGVGYVVKINSENTVHLTHFTGSKVDEWSTIQYQLKDYDDERYNNSNNHIKSALLKLKNNELLKYDIIENFKIA